MTNHTININKFSFRDLDITCVINQDPTFKGDKPCNNFLLAEQQLVVN